MRPHRKKSSKAKSAARAKSLRPRKPVVRASRRDKTAGKWFERLVALQARLRGPGGCPWDREQSHESLRKFLVEETYEVLDAMESGDEREFAGELGDLLLQVVFHSIVAEEAGSFTITDVIESIHDKMVRRHPHVFGNVRASTAKDVLRNWEQVKAAERADKDQGKDSAEKRNESVLAGVPRSLPALLEADQLTQKASRIGFDWENLEGILEKLEEETIELVETVRQSRDGRATTTRIEEEAGDLLFAAVNVARFLDVNPEIALKKANQKFKQRFQWMEAEAARAGRKLADFPRAEMEELWNTSKAQAMVEASSVKK